MITLTVKPNHDRQEEGGSFPGLTGRVIYRFNECSDNVLSFHCGPETDDGYLLDCSDCGIYKQLEELFSDTGIELNVGAAENYHEVVLTNGNDSDKVWSVIETRLVSAGAVEMK